MEAAAQRTCLVYLASPMRGHEIISEFMTTDTWASNEESHAITLWLLPKVLELGLSALKGIRVPQADPEST